MGFLSFTVSVCPVATCKTILFSEKGLKRHWINVHEPEATFHQCPEDGCSIMKKRKNDLARHLTSTHLMAPEAVKQAVNRAQKVQEPNPSFVEPVLAMTEPEVQPDPEPEQMTEPVAEAVAEIADCVSPVPGIPSVVWHFDPVGCIPEEPTLLAPYQQWLRKLAGQCVVAEQSVADLRLQIDNRVHAAEEARLRKERDEARREKEEARQQIMELERRMAEMRVSERERESARRRSEAERAMQCTEILQRNEDVAICRF